MILSTSLFWILFRTHFAQRPFRVVLSLVGVSLGVMASVAITTANVDVLRSFEEAVTAVAGPATLEVLGGDLGVDETVITTVRAVPGVVTAVPVIEDSVVMVQGARRGEAAQLFGLDLIAEVGTRGFRLHTAGNQEALEQLLASNTAYLGPKLAEDWHLTVGSPFEVMAGGRLVRLQVGGLLHGETTRSSVWDRAMLMDIAAAQVLFGSIGQLDRIDVITTQDRPVEDVQAALRAVLSPHLIVQRPTQRTKQVEQMVRSFQLNVRVLSWVGLLVGTFLIYNTTAFMVARRRREIGIYRALGMTERRVASLFLAEAGFLGMVGGVTGGICGVLLSRSLISLVSRTISDLYAPVSPSTSALVFDHHQWWSLTQGILLGMIVSMIGAWGPSLDASRTITVRALAPGDYEVTQQLRLSRFAWTAVILACFAGVLSLLNPVGGLPVFGYLATLCLLAGLACAAPVCIQALGFRRRRNQAVLLGLGGSLRLIAIDHAARHPGRNGVTVSALMVGLAIMIGVVVMVRSFRQTVQIWVSETVIADMVVAPPAWLHGRHAGQASRALPGAWAAKLASIDGVAAVDTYRDVHVDVQGQSVALISRDLRLHAERSRYLVIEGDSATVLRRAAETGGVLVSEVLANRLGVREGLSVAVTTPSGVKNVPIVARFYDYATDGGKMVMDRALYQTLWHDDRVTVFPIYLRTGADGDAIRRSLTQRLAVDERESFSPLVISNAELRREILDIFDRTFVLTYVLEAIAVLIAVLGIVNTLVTAVLERRRELATLQAIGASPAQVKQLVLWEAAYLGLLGAVLGVIGGVLLAVVLIKVINRQSFGWTIQMTVPIDVLAQAVLLALGAALIAGYWPAHWAAHQPVVEGLREE
ncbi:MAG TPA: FtsX-like permease family protein [Nitrospiraceae bacterium]|nr:FtsX-like permease family protein [Nitrospiraceae bacterium]